MTTEPAVEIRGLSKTYRRGAIGAKSLRDELAGLADRWRGRAPRTDKSLFHALSDVSFSVPAGQVCGVIGRNGSGKTTLLKLLSSITAPDSGEAILRGRVGSLLEVGAGFHPELDGVENIYLNGAILGMSRREIAGKLDQIIDFADIGGALETPVKRYSSGMYVRLAFAIAAYLEPEILIIDEVLAVGDAEFQRKCIGRMRTVAEAGRTVLFVSHNMAMVRQLCSICAHLEHGRLKAFGERSGVIDSYLSSLAAPGSRRERTGDESIWGEVAIRDAAGTERTNLVFGQDYEIALSLDAREPLLRCVAHVSIHDREGALIASLESLAEGVDQFDLEGAAEIAFSVPTLALLPGAYFCGFKLYLWGEEEPTFAVDNALDFEIAPATVNDALWPYQPVHGVVRLSRSASLRRR